MPLATSLSDKKWAYAALWLLAALTLLAFYRGLGFVNDWKFTHFLFDYDDEFLKRALVGELFRWVFEHTTYELVNVVAHATLGLLTLVLFFLFSRPWLQDRSNTGAFLFAAVALSSPVTIQHFAFDVGRFDHFNLLLTIVSLLALRVLGTTAGSLVVVSLLLTSLLIHEASFLMYVPLVLAYWHFRDSSLRATVFQVIVFLVLLGATYAISNFGTATVYSLSEHVRNLQQQYGERVVEISVKVLHDASLIENMKRTYYLGVNVARLWEHVALFTFLSPLLFLLYRISEIAFRARDFRLMLLFLSALSPLALYPLGHDHFRWWSLAMTNLMLVVSLILLDRQDLKAKITEIFSRYRFICLLAIFAALAVGPLGITSSFEKTIFQ